MGCLCARFAVAGFHGTMTDVACRNDVERIMAENKTRADATDPETIIATIENPARRAGPLIYGSALKPSVKPFRSTGMPMPSSGVSNTVKVASAPSFRLDSRGSSRITSA